MKLRELEYIPQVLTKEQLLNQAGLGDKPMSIEELSLPKVGKKKLLHCQSHFKLYPLTQRQSLTFKQQ